MPHLKKPILIRKLILLLSVLAVLIPMLTGCQSAPTSSYEPLSDEKIVEIRAAWDAAPEPPLGHRDYHYLIDFASPNNYYGTHGDCIVMFHEFSPIDVGLTGCIRVADLEIRSSTPARLIVYRNGEFSYIEKAYASGWLTKEQIESIVEHHNTTYNYDPYH